MSTVTGSGRLYGLKTVAVVPEIAWIVAAGMWPSGGMSLWASDGNPTDPAAYHFVAGGAPWGSGGTGGAAAVPPGDIRHRYWQLRLDTPWTGGFWSGVVIDYFRLIQADHTDLLHLQDGLPWPVPVGPITYVGPVVPYVATMWQSVPAEPGRSLRAILGGVQTAGYPSGPYTYGPVAGDQAGPMWVEGPYLAAGGCTATWTFDIAVDPTIPPEGIPGQPPMRLHGVVGV